MKGFYFILILVIITLIYRPMVEVANSSTEVRQSESQSQKATSSEVVIDQKQSQSVISYGSTSSSNLTLSTTTISQRPFPAGGQPQFPGVAPGYGGPWKEGWNIITTGLYKLFETFWPVREAKKAEKEGGKVESLYWEIPYRGSCLLPPTGGVNVIFKLNPETSLPSSAVPIGVVLVKGGEKTVLWQLVARAVLEASKRGASFLEVEFYNYSPRIRSSAFGLGLATTGAAINNAGDLSGVSGGGTGWVKATAGPTTEPFIHCVAYTTSSILEAAIKQRKEKERIKVVREKRRGGKYYGTFKEEEITIQRPEIKVEEESLRNETFIEARRIEALKMRAKLQPDPEKNVIYASLKNTTKESIYVTPINFRLETEGGKVATFSFDTYTYPSRFFGKRLEPGEEIGGFLVFKAEGVPLRLVYDDGIHKVSSIINLN